MKFLVEVRRAKKYFPVKRTFLEGLFGKKQAHVRAVDDVSLQIREGETFALVGESGSGKTTLGKLTLAIYPLTSGHVIFDGQDVALIKGRDAQVFRRSAQMVYQDPVAALNPRITVGEAIREPLEFNHLGSPSGQKTTALNLMKRVGLDPPEEFYGRYSHEISGGQRQRVVIARSLVLRPRFLVADEPVAMLDVSVRAQILKLLLDLKREMNLTILVITHDLAIAKYFADSVAIMYLGQIVEAANKDDVFKNPMHPYTKALFSSVPIPDPTATRARMTIQGEIPSASSPPPACRFHTRCPFVFDRCRVEEPPLVEKSPGHYVACHLYDR